MSLQNERDIAKLTNEKQSAYDEISTLKGQNEKLSTDKVRASILSLHVCVPVLQDELTKQCAVMEQLRVENTELNKTVQSQHSQVQSLQKEVHVCPVFNVHVHVHVRMSSRGLCRMPVIFSSTIHTNTYTYL